MNRKAMILWVLLLTMSSLGGRAQSTAMLRENVKIGIQAETHPVIAGDGLPCKSFNLPNTGVITITGATETQKIRKHAL